MSMTMYRTFLKPQLVRCLYLSNSKYSSVETSSIESLTVTYSKGLYHLTVPLVSRQENCLFMLKPTIDSVGDVMQFITNEDPGIKDVSILNKDGILVSQSDELNVLMREDFLLKLNDKLYTVAVPEPYSVAEPLESQEMDVAKGLVSELYRSINQDFFFSHTEKILQQRLEKQMSELQPLEKKREELSALSAMRNKRIAWLSLGGMGFQFGILARLTWWDYSWDVMEPVTYFLGMAYGLGMLGYYVVTKQEYTYENTFNRLYLMNIFDNSKKKRFDMDRYNELKEDVNITEDDLRRLRHTMKLAVPLQPRSTDA